MEPHSEDTKILEGHLNATYLKVINPFERVPKGHIQIGDFNKVLAAPAEQTLGQILPVWNNMET